jgi:AcrR family transcriptional regulator
MMNHSQPHTAAELKNAAPTRAQQKHARILQTSMRYFAELGYEATRVADIAQELGIAKGSIFQHFGSKDGLFLEAYKSSLQSFPAFLDAPLETIQQGFFAVLQLRLQQSEQFKREHSLAYRIVLLGNYGSDLKLKKQINRYLITEDPLGTEALVKMGLERGEIRSDIDKDLVVSIVDWTFERFQDALLMEEFDPGLFRRSGEPKSKAKEERIEEFVTVLRSAIGSNRGA